MKIFYSSIFLEITTAFKYSIVTNSNECTVFGKQVIRMDGSIIDSAIGVMLCEGIVSPQVSGGGFTGTVFINSSSYMIDARESAPQDLKFSDLKSNIHKVGIPGALRGYQLIHNKWGKIQLSFIFRAAAQMCKKGIIPDSRLKNLILTRYREFIFLLDKNKIRNQRLCNTLEKISKHGVNFFYNNISVSIVEDLKVYKSKIKKEDFVKYKALIRKPSYIKLNKSIEFYSTTYPGVGKILLDEIRNMFKGKYNLYDSLQRFYNSTQQYRFKKFYKKYLKHHIRHENKIHGTTNICIKGNNDGLCFTSTINHYFASTIVGNSTGIILNNQLDDFPYFYRDGKINGERPPSYASATIMLKNRKPILLLGGTGGARIPSGILNVMNYMFVERIPLGLSIQMIRM